MQHKDYHYARINSCNYNTKNTATSLMFIILHNIAYEKEQCICVNHEMGAAKLVKNHCKYTDTAVTVIRLPFSTTLLMINNNAQLRLASNLTATYSHLSLQVF